MKNVEITSNSLRFFVQTAAAVQRKQIFPQLLFCSQLNLLYFFNNLLYVRIRFCAYRLAFGSFTFQPLTKKIQFSRDEIHNNKPTRSFLQPKSHNCPSANSRHNIHSFQMEKFQFCKIKKGINWKCVETFNHRTESFPLYQQYHNYYFGHKGTAADCLEYPQKQKRS